MRFFLLALLTAAACSSSSSSDPAISPDDSPDASSPSTPLEAGSSSRPDSAAADASADAPVTSEDPKTDGPFAFTETDVAGAGGTTLHIVTPTGVSAPVPVVLIAPGYLIPASEYLGYAKRLASHGIAGVNVGFASGLSQKAEGDALAAALDALPANLDAMHAGVMGHSRGGKSSVIAAAEEPRFVALLGLDPVDSKPPFTTCDPVTECPDASDLAKTLKIPTGFLGETLDSTGTLQACAPAADNYTTFYASAPSPSFEVTLAGASHMSFIDDPSACGVPFVCTSCKTPTLSQKDALGVAYSYTAAFFLRHLRGDVGQAAFLAGADATK